MRTKKTPGEIAKEIETIYQEYEKELEVLGAERDVILAEFRQELEKEKIEDIKKKLSN